jgi:hypothetical protein
MTEWLELVPRVGAIVKTARTRSQHKGGFHETLSANEKKRRKKLLDELNALRKAVGSKPLEALPLF